MASIRRVDPRHPIFYEPDLCTEQDAVSLPFPGLVLNFHNYYEPIICEDSEAERFAEESRDRGLAVSAFQPHGPAWFMSEFGATNDAADINNVTNLADANLAGWTFWEWNTYNEPTATPPGIVVDVQGPGGVNPRPNQPKTAALTRTYAQFVSGTPTLMSFDPATDAFQLRYKPAVGVTEPTVIFVSANTFGHYPNGYCLKTAGATATKRDATHVLLTNMVAAAEVAVSIDRPSSSQGCTQGS
jgi:hypothetical protein